MRVYWWQGGLFFDPETDEEREALKVLVDNLKFAPPAYETETGEHSGDEFDHKDSCLFLGEANEVIS